MDSVTTEYEVNEEKRTVVCIITTVDDMKRRLEKYNLADDDYNEEELDIRVYKGIAKCDPEDEWDEVYGKRLAEYRASRARQIDINNEIKRYINSVTRCIDNLYDYGLLKTPHYPQR